jgi:ABC-type lipoprotein export system ATPase subunit
MIKTIEIRGGRGKRGEPESVAAVRLAMGQVASVVGPTGSGKTTLINDFEIFADGSTPTGRVVLVDGEPAGDDLRDDPASHPIALITQHTNFLSDLPVLEFLHTHARVRGGSGFGLDAVTNEVLAFANELTGEPIEPGWRMTELSGGQTRALLIADAVVIGNAPIILLDEIENAGIHRMRALELLRRYEKIFVFVTHDPYIALLSDVRIVMSGGAMAKLLTTSDPERRLAHRLRAVDESLLALRERIRLGESLEESHLEVA